jgi:hypothetical protein
MQVFNVSFRFVTSAEKYFLIITRSWITAAQVGNGPSFKLNNSLAISGG